MNTRIPESAHQLSGDWTISGVVSQLDSLSSSLEKMSSTPKKRIHIDCGHIDSIDMSGLQLLHVWMQCVNMRGVHAELINLPDGMQQAIQRMGLDQCFSDNYPAAA